MSDRTRALTIEVEAEGRTFDFSNQELALIPKSVKLRFLRYGFFYKKEGYFGVTLPAETSSDNPTTSTIELAEVEVLAPPKGAPSLENFSVSRTTLNSGYLYVFDANDNDLWHEYLIDKQGVYHKILWKNNNPKEIRIPNAEVRDYVLVELGKTVWVAYSPVQWSVKFHKKMRTSSSKEKYMKKIKCNGFKDGETNHDGIYPYNEINIAIPKKEDNIIQHNKQKATVKSLLQKLNSIDEKEKKEAQKGNHTREDMFVTIHDAIGCAIDINEVTSKKILYHRALIDAIQTGQTIKESYNRILNGNLEAKVTNAEYQAMYSLALTSYLMVYNDYDSINKYDGKEAGNNYFETHAEDDRINVNYGRWGQRIESKNVRFAIGKGLDHKKLVGILGIEERKKSRNNVINFRNDLGDFMQCDYLKKPLEFYLFNIKERTLDGRDIMLSLLENLAINPYILERHMLLKKHYETKDKWETWVYDIINDENQQKYLGGAIKSEAPEFNGIDPSFALLAVGLDIDDIIDVEKVSNKLAKVYKKKLTFHAKQVFSAKTINGVHYKEIVKKQEFIVSRLNKNLKVFGKEMFEIRRGDIVLKLEELGVQIDPDYVTKGKYIGKKEDVLRFLKSSEGIDLGKSSRGHHELNMRVMKGVDEQSFSKNSKNIKIATLVNGRAFNGVFAALEFYNFIAASSKVVGEKSNWKDRTNLLSSSVKLTEAGLNFTKAMVKNSARERTIYSLGRFASVAGAVGGVATSAMCFWDAFDAHKLGDDDSALALVGAGIAFGVAAGVSITAVAAVSSTAIGASIAGTGVALGLMGPVGWIAALVGVGFLVISQWLKDNPLEAYFKHFLLGDSKAIYIDSGESPIAYTKRLLIHKDELVPADLKDRADLVNPYNASAILMDLMVCTNVTFKVLKSDLKQQLPQNKLDDGFHFTVKAHKFKATMTYYKFFNKLSQVRHQLFFYPYGLRSKPIPLDIKPTLEIVHDVNNNKAVQLTFELSDTIKNQITRGSKLLFATRLKVDNQINSYFPYILNGKDRWLGCLVKLYAQNSASIYDQKLSFKVAPIIKLQNNDLW